MPKIGYRSITLSDSVYSRLVEVAKKYGTTPPVLIKTMLSDDKNNLFHERFSLLGKRAPAEPDILGSNPSGPAKAFLSLKAKNLGKNPSEFDQAGKACGTDSEECTVQLDKFVEFCLVDLRLNKSTARQHRNRIKKVLEGCPHSLLKN